MEYDDRFNANINNDFDNDKLTLQDIKYKLDKRYHVINKQILFNKDYKKNIKIELHGSGDVGTTIRDAETGKYYKGHLVGSSDEDLYFKISHSVPSINNEYRESLTLFYISPEHYERHQYVNLNESVKQRWYTKNQAHMNK